MDTVFPYLVAVHELTNSLISADVRPFSDVVINYLSIFGWLVELGVFRLICPCQRGESETR